METLFGHQDAVLSLDCWQDARPLTGAADRSLRVWKVQQSSHLVFRKHAASADCTAYLTQERFVSGGQDGRLLLWSDSSRNPLAAASCAHGKEAATDRWVTSLATLRSSDVFASGSHDGFVRIWGVGESASAKASKGPACTLQPLLALPAPGFVNGLVMRDNLVLAAVGREHRLGRWWSLPYSECKNRLVISRYNLDV
ncbi:hypothetical protein EON64_13930 [archaeon]|nr:MAG: hypothetical protein EON64_13930 [archaeon]